MVNIRLRTKFLLSLIKSLLSLILTTTVLTGTVLFIVQIYSRNHARREIHEALNDSVNTFQQFELQRQRGLAQSAVLLADLPDLRALMTTQHAPTIQDASGDLWRLSGSDLFLLADRTGKVMAVHTASGGYTPAAAQAALTPALEKERTRDWWYSNGHLYAVFLQPIYFGEPRDNVVLGLVALGFEVDQHLAEAVARVASCPVAFRYGRQMVVSTLLPVQQQELAARGSPTPTRDSMNPEETTLGREVFSGQDARTRAAGKPTGDPDGFKILRCGDAIPPGTKPFAAGRWSGRSAGRQLADLSYLLHVHTATRQSRVRRAGAGDG